MTWDLIVIGGGSGGLTAAIMAGEIGASVLLVDKKRLGGDCTWFGCVPSKALIASARAAHEARRASEFGIGVGEVQVDFRAVMERVARLQNEIAETETPAVLAHHGVEVAFGGATFMDAHTIRIGADRIERADNIVISTGSSAAAPPIDGLVEAGYLNNENVFDLRELPRRLVVIGGGPIGSELGQCFARLGSRVTLLQGADRVLDREDPEASAVLGEVLVEEGVDLHLSTYASRVEVVPGGKRVHYTTAGEDGVVECDEVLVAVGRRANTAGLNLEAAGVGLWKRGIEVNEWLQTSQKHIFAVGDCNGGPQFTHWAEYEGRIATRNILFRGWEARVTENIPWVTFTEPEVARVGLTVAEAEERGLNPIVHRVPLSKVDRAVCSGTTNGFAKVVLDENARVLGAHIVASHGGELLPEWVLAMKCKLTLPQIGSTIHAYPTLNRANRRLADEAFFKDNIAGWKKSLFGTFRGRTHEPNAGFVATLLAFFSQPDAERAEQVPEGLCTNCWGHFEYDGQVVAARRERHIDVANRVEHQAFIEAFVVEHVDGIRLRTDAGRTTCRRCGS